MAYTLTIVTLTVNTATSGTGASESCTFAVPPSTVPSTVWTGMLAAFAARYTLPRTAP